MNCWPRIDRRVCRRRVAQAEVERHVRPRAPLVVHVADEVPLAERAVARRPGPAAREFSVVGVFCRNAVRLLNAQAPPHWNGAHTCRSRPAAPRRRSARACDPLFQYTSSAIVYLRCSRSNGLSWLAPIVAEPVHGDRRRSSRPGKNVELRHGAEVLGDLVGAHEAEAQLVDQRRGSGCGGAPP